MSVLHDKRNNMGGKANEFKDARIMELEMSLKRHRAKEPLTLDEMMHMIGEPVWVVTDRLSEWCIIHSFHPPEVYGRAVIMTCRTGQKKQYPIVDHGVRWRAYRHKIGEE